jgi:hypothetical protein
VRCVAGRCTVRGAARRLFAVVRAPRHVRISEPRLSHHNASAQVFADGDKRSRLVWTADLLPDEFAGEIRTMMEHGAAAMQKAFEKR